MYNSAPLAPPDKFNPRLDESVYVKLALVKKEKVTRMKADELTRLTFEADFVDQILSAKEEIKIGDILKGENTRLVVVEGAPGIGKSTLAWELCRQWPTMESLQRFSLVVLLKLREKEVQSAKSISDLFPWEDDLDKSRLVAEKVKEENGKGVLFVFDGFDEFSADLREISPVMKVIKGTFLPRSTIVLTSRPSATADLQPFLDSVNAKHIEVVGFAETNIQSCVEQVFGSGSDILASFNAYLSANPVVKGMMYNPLNCAIILEVYQATAESGRPIPHTQTQLYTEMTLWRLSRYLSDIGNPLSKNLPNKLEDLPHDSDLYQQLVKVGKLAYDEGVKGRVIFEDLPEGCEDLGLLIKHTALYRRNETSTYNFFHLTMQEYMSAFYISQLPVNQQRKLLGKQRTLLVKDEISNVVWKFVAGLTKMKDVGWDVVPPPATWWSCGDDVHDVVVDELFVQCLYEAQDVQCLESKFGLDVVEFKNHRSISNYEAFALGYCISKTHNTWDIVISKSPAFDFEYVILGCGLKYVAGSGVVNRLTYSIDKKTEIHDNVHSPIHRIKSLEFSDYGLFRTDRTGFGNLAEYLPYLQNLILRLAHDSLEPGVAILLKALRGHRKLESLCLWGMDTNVDDVNALMALVESSSCCLRRLYMSLAWYALPNDPDLPLESYRKLGRTLLSSRSSLETVYIANFPPTVLDYVDDIAENILHLDLRTHRTVDPSGIKYGTKLSQILRMNTSLKGLHVDMTLDKNEVCDILHSLEDNHTLEILEIRENDYVHQGYSLKSDLEDVSDLEDDSDLNSESELDSAQSKDTPHTPEELVQNDICSLGSVEPMTESASEPLPTANPSGVKGGVVSNFLRRNTSLKELAFLFLSDRDELYDIVESLGDNHTLEKLELPEELKSEYSSMNIEDPRISWRGYSNFYPAMSPH